MQSYKQLHNPAVFRANLDLVLKHYAKIVALFD